MVAFKVLDPWLSACLALFGLAIFAHVAGNALGTRLRNHGNVRVDAGPAPRPRIASEEHFAPATRLSEHHRLGWWMWVMTGLGALLGACAGGAFLAAVNWERATVANVSLAASSCAVLGGLLGFWTGSFAQVVTQALWHAHQGADADRRHGLPAEGRRQDQAELVE